MTDEKTNKNNMQSIDIIKKAHDFAKTAHEGQKRKSGEPYFVHPKHVVDTLMQLGLDDATIAAGYLHDVVEDCDFSYDDIKDEFGQEVAELVMGVTKLEKMDFDSKEQAQAENMRNMLLAMAKDIRVVLIKLADRLHNMRTLRYRSEPSRKAVARETLNIYAPLAHRLGISKIKWELEDLSFSYLYPQEYTELSQKISMRREQREDIILGKIEHIKKELKAHKIKAEIEGRPKHFYSIYQKMEKQDKPFEEIYDLTAIRIIVDDVRDCYGALGIVHTIWTPIPGRFKDYIAMPKQNLYQSLHTTLMGEHGSPFEVQIRTNEMHDTAEYGIAAHWRYKEKNLTPDKNIDNKLADMRQSILEWQNEATDALDFMDNMISNLFSEDVYVFTPKGDVFNLPTQSNPIDFAYKVHSAVGNKCTGARVNGKMVTLDTALKTGDIVEIITSKNSNGPSRDWLNIVKTSQAKSKIRAYFKKAGREDNIDKGRTMLEEMAKRNFIPISRMLKREYCDAIVKRFALKSFDDILAAIGYGGITTRQVYAKLQEEYAKDHAEKVPEVDIKDLEVKDSKPQKKKISGGVIVKGEKNMLVRYSKCCNPVPFDEIVGYITRGRGVSIHRIDCYNIKSQQGDARLIEVEWENQINTNFQASLHISMHDEQALLIHISNIIQSLGISLMSINAQVNKQRVVNIDLLVEISKKEQIVNMMGQIRRMPECIEIYRKNG